MLFPVNQVITTTLQLIEKQLTT